MKTKSAPPALNVVAEAAADGVKLVQPAAGLLSVSQQPVQVPIGRLLPPLTRFAGKVNVMFTFAAA